MQRFILKQWREDFEEVIIEAENLPEAQSMAEGYPEYIGMPFGVKLTFR